LGEVACFFSRVVFKFSSRHSPAESKRVQAGKKKREWRGKAGGLVQYLCPSLWVRGGRDKGLKMHPAVLLDERFSALSWVSLLEGEEDGATSESKDGESLKPLIVEHFEGAMERVRQHALSVRIFSAVFKWVPPDYYERPLHARATLLSCKESQMCKSMVMENTAIAADCSAEEAKLRYVVVVVQYAAKFNAEKLALAVRSLPSEARKPKKAFHFRLAPEAVAIDLAGFKHNAVSPLGLLTSLPVVIAQAISELSSPFIWMGGGHVNLKLGCTFGHLARALQPIVADISDPR
jgi:prolyl-tRNA editing enzyme YbaK/EbsC (Cys-tRNA(Pro) deacylase)